MKRFLIFGGYTYYPVGGVDDFDGMTDSAERAVYLCENNKFDWAHIAVVADNGITIIVECHHAPTGTYAWSDPDGSEISADNLIAYIEVQG